MGALQQKESIIKINLPVVEHSMAGLRGMHTDLQHIISMMSYSCDNSLFKVSYTLDVYVKHKSKLEFGRGNMVSFPITIRSQGKEPIPFL